MTEQRDDDPMAGVRPYIQLASGLLEMSATKAAELAQGLWTQGGDTVGDAVDSAMEQGAQVAALLTPDQVRALVREEVDHMVRRLGFARADELASLRREVGRLEQQVGALQQQLDAVQDASSKQGAKAGKKNGKKSHGKKDD